MKYIGKIVLWLLSTILQIIVRISYVLKVGIAMFRLTLISLLMILSGHLTVSFLFIATMLFTDYLIDILYYKVLLEIIHCKRMERILRRSSSIRIVDGFEAEKKLAYDDMRKWIKDDEFLSIHIIQPRGYGAVSWPEAIPSPHRTSYILLPYNTTRQELRPFVLHELGHIANMDSMNISFLYAISLPIMIILGLAIHPSFLTVSLSIFVLYVHFNLVGKASNITNEIKANEQGQRIARMSGADPNVVSRFYYERLLNLYAGLVKGKRLLWKNIFVYPIFDSQMRILESSMGSAFTLQLLDEFKGACVDNIELSYVIETRTKIIKDMPADAEYRVSDINNQEILSVIFAVSFLAFGFASSGIFLSPSHSFLIGSFVISIIACLSTLVISETYVLRRQVGIAQKIDMEAKHIHADKL